ncbi:aspartate-semialdehyde dehydrogenase [Deinococcus maricopensis]|uniref:Aspartate-semialdehyde dehydrogenase n=1 Tax=Deinococcus maricopensis (strain DSM 21211 / LMG 22137 / NRRL B-23946 / LB-34) TaxID=709986 RepID=E8UB72_DEIML|nr:aspartate-semialdehyde dehydrogenase [Deinococcus maricopensis]ADV68311.1 aspartate-semialdehyde dehydrogenase [Deinococcus maricopensis DSM 21211]
MRVAIVGATGAVGHELLSVLERSPLQFTELQLYASPRSAGTTLPFRGQDLTVQVTPEGAIPADVILASAGASISKALAPAWVAGGAVVIDNSSAFRYDDHVPLVVPEVNGEAALQHQGIIANPNCTTAIAAVAVYPLHRQYGVRRMIVSTYQATSGAGAKGMDELLEGTRAVLDGAEATAQVFAHPIPFNVIPHIDAFQANGYTKEEMKVVWETRKIFGEPDLVVSCTAVRIPTLRTHSEAITLELERPATPDEARDLLRGAPGVEVRDNPGDKLYPMPLTASGKYAVEVGRIRESLVFPGGLELFVAGDQLLKGAALNAVQIAEYLQQHGALPQ